MRQKRPDKPLEELCALFGVSRQAYYLAQKMALKTDISHMVVLGPGVRIPFGGPTFRDTETPSYAISGDGKAQYKNGAGSAL